MYWNCYANKILFYCAAESLKQERYFPYAANIHMYIVKIKKEMYVYIYIYNTYTHCCDVRRSIWKVKWFHHLRCWLCVWGSRSQLALGFGRVDHNWFFLYLWLTKKHETQTHLRQEGSSDKQKQRACCKEAIKYKITCGQSTKTEKSRSGDQQTQEHLRPKTKTHDMRSEDTQTGKHHGQEDSSNQQIQRTCGNEALKHKSTCE